MIAKIIENKIKLELSPMGKRRENKKQWTKVWEILRNNITDWCISIYYILKDSGKDKIWENNQIINIPKPKILIFTL